MGMACTFRWHLSEVPLIAFLTVQLTVALGQNPVIFQYDRIGLLNDISVTRGLTLQVQDDPNANIIKIQKDDFALLGDVLANDLPKTLWWLYKNPVKLSHPPTVASFSTMFTFQLDLDDQRSFDKNISAGFSADLRFIIASDTLPALQLSVDIALGSIAQSQYPLDVFVTITGGPSTDVLFVTNFIPMRRLGEEFFLLNKVAVTMWVEYDSSTQRLDVFLTGTGDETCNSASTDSPFVCKPITGPWISVGNVNFTDGISQDNRHMFVGFRSRQFNGSTCNFTLNSWTFNSDGPAPDFRRDSDGRLVDLEKEKRDRDQKRKRLHQIAMITGTIVPPVLVLLILVCIICRLYKRNARLTALTLKYEIEKGSLEDQGPKNFKYRLLKTATKGFSPNELLGSGGFGSVYRGRLVLSKGDQQPSEVAVKRISATSRQGAQEFLAEVKTIGRAQHRNLVRLLGWCHQHGELLLVYDYMPNGSLDQLLYSQRDCANDGKPSVILTWARRLGIVLGVANALSFLHEEWEHRVIHRDIKSSNVMIDRDFNSRLGDFGLARLSEHGQAPPSTAVLAGTYGYMAPELLQTLKFTEKTDVYSFGALVLEVATGKKPLLGVKEFRTSDDLFLVDWVWGLYGEDKLLDAADCRLLNAYDPGEMVTFLKLGLLCSHPDPEERPKMRDVINIWNGSVSFPPLPRSKPIPIYAFIPHHEEDADSQVVTLTDHGYCCQPDEPRARHSGVDDSDSCGAVTFPSRYHEDSSGPQEEVIPGQRSGPPYPTARLHHNGYNTASF